MSIKKMPWIRQVSLARIDDSLVIPTVLYYENKKPFIGREARDRCGSPELLVEDFKIELGDIDATATESRSKSVEFTPRRTPVGLAKDFFDEALRKINEWLQVEGFPLPNKILIAEPLSLGAGSLANEAWLTNYRRAVRRALPSSLREADFMPEPFAVFQYYRYGAGHPLVAEQRKHVALVLDFGGGTFDVSVVETTKQGDISGSGINSRPLSAKSISIGGFYINRIIAEDFLFSVLAARIDKSDVRKAIENFYKNKNADEEYILSLSERQIAFFRNYKRLLQVTELAKVSVCRATANWSLTADLAASSPYPMQVPINPFSDKPEYANVRLDAGKLRKLFEERIWNARLRETIRTTLTRARDDLRGQEISLVLLSGGSSNIRWLTSLLERDLRKSLPEAQILELNEDFQEIVAKGLATECARRHYTEGQGDFRAVTYNRLCLALRPDEGDLEIRRFESLTEPLRKRSTQDRDSDEGVLLPSASSLRGLIGQPLRWRVRLSRPPRRHLEYYFMRASFDPDDAQNVEEVRINTPRNINFQSSIEIELTVREDGTAEPRFIYGPSGKARVDGRPFWMDMTFATEEVEGESYLGFDFGTSTSACSFIHTRDIQLIEKDSQSSGWKDLSDLVDDLPYPCAAPLARYMSEADPERRMHRGREAAEAMLTLVAYTSFTELCTQSKQRSAHFKGFAHRSAGPLWALCKHCLREPANESSFSVALRPLISPETTKLMDAWVSQLPDTKHTRAVEIDYVSFLGRLGNPIAKMFSNTLFGVFENVTAKKFSHGRFRGIFRDLRGHSQTFIHVLDYEGTIAFSDAEIFIVQPSSGTALGLSPLYLWGLNLGNANEEPDLFEFDTITKSGFSYKAVQLREAKAVTNDGEFKEIWSSLADMRYSDPEHQIIKGLTFALDGAGD